MTRKAFSSAELYRQFLLTVLIAKVDNWKQVNDTQFL